MSAVISESQTVWNKETKQTDVSITLFNYTSRARAYTILAAWPEKEGAMMENNTNGGRKEATGVWAWKLDTLEPGQTFTLTYSLSGLERGDWTETDVFYRGSQEVIGATKMDEKLLEELRRQEEILDGVDEEDGDGADLETPVPSAPTSEDGEPRSSGQQTLMGYGSDA
jgi:hypothetical protein